jgi:carboxyl-terminal processing protease
MGKSTRFLILAVLLVLVIDAALIVPILLPKPSETAGLEAVEEAWRVIINNYVDKGELDLRKLSNGAIRGMLEALGDPYSAYFDAEESKVVKDINIEGSYGGIGAVVGIRDGQLVVIAPIEDTPAKRAGIKAGDRILEIDGESTEGMSLTEAVYKIQGEPGTQVTLKVLHIDGQEPVILVITREKIEVDTVFFEVLENNIAYIQITFFSERTSDEIVAALEEVLAQNVAGIILDLRDNPGGPVDSAVKVASQFLNEGIVLYAVDSDGEKQVWSVETGGLATDLPLVVLVNGGSASASEVIAGALQDYGRASLIGVKTFGKGSINILKELSDGSAIYLTIGRWFTPNGRQIEGQGLTPHIVVERTEQDIEQGKDPQLDRAIEYIKSQL